MLATTLLILTLLGSAHACSTSTSYVAGIVCRITKPALLVLNQETAKVIQTAFQRAPYPDIKGEKAMMFLGQVKYGLHKPSTVASLTSVLEPVLALEALGARAELECHSASIHISHLSVASSQVELVDAKSVDVSIQNASVIFKGTLNYGYTGAWGLNIEQSVDFEIESAIDLKINTQLTCSSGKVRTDAPDCSLSFHKLLLHLQGEREPGWIKQLFTNFISFTLKLVLKGQICKEITVISNIMADFVQTRAANTLSDGDIEVDISLTRSPVITTTYLESHHKGFFVYKNVSEELPLPTFSPTLLGDSRMLYFWFSEQVLDSLAKVAFQDGRFQFSLSAVEFKALLETWSFNPNQEIIPELFSRSLTSPAQVTVRCPRRPTISCQNKGVVVNSPVVLEFLSPRDDGQGSVAHTFEKDIVTTIQASYSKKKLFLNLVDFHHAREWRMIERDLRWLKVRREEFPPGRLHRIKPKATSSKAESSSESIQSFLQLMITTVGIPEVISRMEVALTTLINSKGLNLFDIINPEITTRDGFLLLQMDFGFPEHLLVDFLQSLS